MRIPFDLFSNSGLGLSASSLGQVELLPRRALNSSQTQIGVNVATGNVVVRDTEFLIEDDGVALTLAMLWNSKSEKGWVFAAAPKLKVTANAFPKLPAKPAALKKPQPADSLGFDSDAESDFESESVSDHWNAVHDVQARAEAVEDTHDKAEDQEAGEFIDYAGIAAPETSQELKEEPLTLTLIEADEHEIAYIFDATRNCFVSTEPDHNGKATISLDPDKKTYTRFFPLTGIEEVFAADGKLLQKNDPTGKSIQYGYREEEVSEITLPSGRVIRLDENGTLRLNDEILAVFDRDKNNKNSLTTTIDNKKTCYKLNTIEKGKELLIQREKESPARIEFSSSMQLQKISDGVREFKFDNSTAATCVMKDTFKNAYTIALSGADISSFTLPTGEKSLYEFRAKQLTKVTEPESKARTIDYDEVTGLPSVLIDTLGQKTTITYSEKGLKLSEKSEDTTEEKSDAFIKRFFYNEKTRQCLYEVSAEGRVTQFEYYTEDAPNKRRKNALKSIQKSMKKINLENFSIASLDAEWQKLDSTQIQKTVLDYDAYGRPNQIIGASKLTKELDGRGRAIASTLEGEAKRTTQFDGLSRPKEESVETTKNQPVTTYTYVDNTTTVARPNQLVEAVVRDEGGLVRIQTRAKLNEEKSTLRQEEYKRNENGAVKKVTREDKKIEYQFQDKSNRLKFSVSADGFISEYEYDSRGVLSCKKDYSIKVDVSSPDTISIDSLTTSLSANKAALSKKSYFNSEKQLTFEVTIKKVINEKGEGKLEGIVTQHVYSRGNRIKTIQHANRVTDFDRTPNLIKPSEADRETRFFYDRDNLLVGEQDAAGFLKQTIRDGAGNITDEIVYLEKFPHLDKLDNLVLKDSPKLVTKHEYNALGLKIKTTDADKIETTFEYYPSGKLKTETTGERVITHEYDELGRESKITNSQTQLQITINYDNDHNEISRTFLDQKTGLSRTTQKRFNAFGEVTHEASARISEAFKDDVSKWTQHEIDPVTGLRLSTTDILEQEEQEEQKEPKKQKTIFYYDDERRPVLEIAADGSITRTEYDALCGKPTLIHRYANRLEKEIIEQKKLKGGFLNDAVSSIIKAKEDKVKDRITQHEYDAEGLLFKTLDPNGAVHRYWYDSFKQCIRESHLVDDKKELVIVHEYDARGNRTKTIKDPKDEKNPNGLNIVTSQKHDDALNRVTETVDESGLTLVSTYSGLRTQTLSDASDSTRKKTIVQDTFFRTQSETDWTNANAIKHDYDDKNRTHTITTAGNRQTIEESNAFGEITSHSVGGRTTQYLSEVYNATKKTFVKETVHPDSTSEIDECNVLGWHKSRTDESGKTTSHTLTATGQIESSTDEVLGDNRTTVFAPNPFGENETITTPDNHVKTLAFTKNGEPERITTDPAGLKLVTQNSYTLSGELKQIQQGDSSDLNQYQENIGRDLLGREIARTVDLGDNKKLTLKEQKFDAAGHVVEIKDGRGNLHRNVFDKRGNCVISIDAEGFAIQREFDANNQEISRRYYAVPIIAEKLNGLSAASTEKEVSACLKPSNGDEVREYRYDSDGLLCFEINHIGSGQAILKKRVYNDQKECIQRIHYANYLALDASLKMNPALIVKDSKDRATDFVRNARGKIIFTRDAEGYLVEKRRDAKGRVIAKIQYQNNYADKDFSSESAVREELKKDKDNVQNREIYFVYDLFGDLRFQIDAKGFIKEFKYDKGNRKTETFCYVNPLSASDLTTLKSKLGDNSASRQVNELLSLLNKKIGELKDEVRDIHLSTSYDNAGRIQAETDGERKEESYELNALGLKRGRTDKRKNKWITQFDRAKRAESYFAPKVDIATITQDEKGELISTRLPDVSVETKLNYDGSSNNDGIVFANNIKGESRTVKKRYNKKNQFIGTEITNVKIDNGGTEALSENGARPEIEVTLTTQKILDYAGREIVDIDELKHRTVSVYGPCGRKRFTIDAGNFVTEWIYDTGFKEPTAMVRYEKPLEEWVLDAFKNCEMDYFNIKHFVLRLECGTRRIEFNYDKRGLKISAEKEQIITAKTSLEKIDDKPVDVKVVAEKLKPKTTFQFNAFREEKQEDVLLDASGTVASTRFLKDKNGNEILIISPKGYVTEQAFGVENCLLKRIERANPLPDNLRNADSDTILNFFTQEKNQSPKDRTYTYQYDRRLLETRKTVSSGQPFYRSIFNPVTQKAEIEKDSDGKKVEYTHLTTGTDFDENGQPIAYLISSNDKRYLNRDARGDVILETDFPLLLDAEQKTPAIPVTAHGVNAHGQAVVSTLFAASGAVDANGNITPPDSDKNKDQTSMVLTDNRGNAAIVQTPEKNRQLSTFDAARKVVRNARWATGYVLSADKKTITPQKVLRQRRTQYDPRSFDAMTSFIDGESETTTYKQRNGYGEIERYGNDPANQPFRFVYDKAGNSRYSNADQLIPTITFPNARGSAAVVFRSPNTNLAAYADLEEKAKEDLLDRPYSETFNTIQRTAVVRDLEDNVIAAQKPWYLAKPKEVPQNVQMSFALNQNFIEWKEPDILGLVPEFHLRKKRLSEETENKGEETEIKEEAWQPLPVVSRGANAQGKQIFGVDVSSFSSDLYEYKLDFYFKDKNQIYHDEYASFRAEGETILDTGNNTGSRHPVYYTKDMMLHGDMRHVLVLTGNHTDIVGIELIQAGKPPKRLAVDTTQSASYRLVDLSYEVNGEYQFKLIKQFKTLQKNIVSAPLSVELHPGRFELTYALQPNDDHTMQIKNAWPLLEIVPINKAVAPIPSRSYQVGPYGVAAANWLPAAFVYGLDQDRQPRFLGEVLPPKQGEYNNNERANPLGASVFSPGTWIRSNDGALIANASALFGTTPKGSFIAPLDTWSPTTSHAKALLSQDGGKTLSGVECDIISLNECETTSIAGSLSLRTAKLKTPMSSREITVTDFTIVKSKAGGVFTEKEYPGCVKPFYPGCTDNYYQYSWNINTSKAVIMQPLHNGFRATIGDISGLALPNETDPFHYQQVVQGDDSAGAALSPMTLLVATDLSNNNREWYQMNTQPVEPESKPVNPSTVRWEDIDGRGYSKMFEKTLERAVYPDMTILVFSPTDPDILDPLQFEYQEKTITNQPMWIPASQLASRPVKEDGSLSVTSITVNVTGFDPGRYSYRFKSKTGYVYGEMTVTKGRPGCAAFVSRSEDEVKALVKPLTTETHDRWKNRASFTNAMGHTTTSEHNLFDQEIKTTTPEVEVVHNDGSKETKSLTTERLINVNAFDVGKIQPNLGETARVVNTAGISLAETDADGVTARASIDVLKRVVGVVGPSGSKIETEYHARGGLLEEIRYFANRKITESLLRNEDKHVIRRENKLGFATHFNKNAKGQDLLRIQPIVSGEDTYRTQAQTFDKDTGLRLSITDEDGNERKWQPKDSSGLPAFYTDLSGQRIELKRDFNQQITEENGDLSNVTKSRGKGVGQDEKGQPLPPPAHHIVYLRDEAGGIVETVDLGANLRTIKRRNKNDFCELYYFVDKNTGRVHQATFTEFDAMERQSTIHDTRILFRLGYDASSNRRFSRVTMYNDNTAPVVQELWYDYSAGNRVMIRDAMLLNGSIEITKDGGIKLTRNPQTFEVDVQTMINLEGDTIEKRLTRYPVGHVNENAIQQIATDRNGVNVRNFEIKSDKGGREIYTKESGCDIRILENQPSVEEYSKYSVPTYVLDTTKWRLTYYKDKKAAGQFFEKDDRLGKLEDRYSGFDYSFFRNNPSVMNVIKDAISQYDANHHAGEEESTSHNSMNHVDSSTTKADNEGYVSTRTVTKKSFATGAPLEQIVETSIRLDDKDKSKKASFTDKTTSTQRFGDQVLIAEVKTERSNIDAPRDYNVDQENPKKEADAKFDSNDNYAEVKNAGDDEWRKLVTNSEHCIVYKHTSKGTNYYFYAEKRPGKMVFMGYFGDLPDELKSKAGLKTEKPRVVKFDNYQPIQSQLQTQPSQFQVPAEGPAMSFEEIAEAMDKTGLGQQLALENNEDDPNKLVESGETVSVPAFYYEAPQTAWNGSLPELTSIVGTLFPSIPMPSIHQKEHHVNWSEVLLEVAVGVAVMLIAPQIFGALAQGGLAGLTTAAAGTAATATTAAVAGSTTAALEVGAVYGLSGAVASAATQGIAIAFGSQQGFDVTAMAKNAVGAAITGGILARLNALNIDSPTLLNFKTGDLATNIVRAEAAAIAQQAATTALGLQKHPDWKSLATAAFNSAAGKAVNEALGDTALALGATTVIDTVGDGAIYGQLPTFKDVSAITIGTLVGTQVGNTFNSAPEDQHHEVEKQKAIHSTPTNDEEHELRYPTRPVRSARVNPNPILDDEPEVVFSASTKKGNGFFARANQANNEKGKATVYNQKPKAASAEGRWDRLIDGAETAAGAVYSGIDKVGSALADSLPVRTLNKFNPILLAASGFDEALHSFQQGSILSATESAGLAAASIPLQSERLAVGAVGYVGASARKGLGLISKSGLFGKIEAKNALEDAFSKYPKQVAQYSKLSNKQLEKAISSHEKQIALHQEKLANPELYVSNWNQLSLQHQENLVHHWNQDIIRHQSYSEIAKNTLDKLLEGTPKNVR